MIFICDQADIYLGLSVRPSGRPSVRSSVRPSGIFDYFPIIRISRNLQGILTLDTWISGHRSQGHPVKVKVTAREKLVVFGVFFILSRTRPTVFIGLCWYHIEMCRMAICKNVMRRNFDFFPQRSNIGPQRSNIGQVADPPSTDGLVLEIFEYL